MVPNPHVRTRQTREVILWRYNYLSTMSMCTNNTSRTTITILYGCLCKHNYHLTMSISNPPVMLVFLQLPSCGCNYHPTLTSCCPSPPSSPSPSPSSPPSPPSPSSPSSSWLLDLAEVGRGVLGLRASSRTTCVECFDCQPRPCLWRMINICFLQTRFVFTVCRQYLLSNFNAPRN